MPPQPRLPRLVLTKIGSNDFNHLTHHLRTISLFCTLQIAVSQQNNLFPINSNNTMQDIMVLKIGQHDIPHPQTIRLTKFNLIDLTTNERKHAPAFRGDNHFATFTKQLGNFIQKHIIRQDNPDGLSATNRVTFAPGVHNSGWHTHGAMMVIGTGGIGYYQEEGLPTQIIRPGDVIEIPEGVKHWHGLLGT